jgi:hypothetical protein
MKGGYSVPELSPDKCVTGLVRLGTSQCQAWGHHTQTLSSHHTSLDLTGPYVSPASMLLGSMIPKVAPVHHLTSLVGLDNSQSEAWIHSTQTLSSCFAPP